MAIVTAEAIVSYTFWASIVLMAFSCEVQGYIIDDQQLLYPRNLDPLPYVLPELSVEDIDAMQDKLEFEQRIIKQRFDQEKRRPYVYTTSRYESPSTQRYFDPLPLPLALIHHTSNDDKRASVMSLCHFKICSLGRKRNNMRFQLQ